jgi:hypothetical protein
MSVMIGQDGAIHMVAGSDWPLEGLSRHYGAAAAYRVTADSGRIRVMGRAGEQTCILESPVPSQMAKLLLAPR